VKVKAIQMSDLFKLCDDIYTTVMIVSQRTKQVIDQRFIPIDENEEVEDSIQFSETEIHLDELEKPMVVALGEYLNGDLQWRSPATEDDLQSDES